MDRTLIQQYASGIVKGFVEQVRSISDMKHRYTKGRLRELFVANVLDRYLTAQFGVGSGIVVNQRGDQSDQMDIIIYDNRVLPPFVREQGIGVFPVEAVIATIEVKSILDKTELRKSEKAAKKLREVVASPCGSIYPKNELPKRPGCTIIGFCDRGLSDLMKEQVGRDWLTGNIESLWAVCLVGKFSWLKLAPKEWRLKTSDEFAEETKQYIGVLLDNVRTQAEHNYRLLCQPEEGEEEEEPETRRRLRSDRKKERHRDWLSVYIRDQEDIRQFFDSRK